MELTGTLSPSGEVGGCGGMGLGSLESPSITTLCCPHPPFSPPSHPTPVRSLSLPHPLVPCHSLSLSPFPLVPCIHPSTTTSTNSSILPIHFSYFSYFIASFISGLSPSPSLYYLNSAVYPPPWLLSLFFLSPVPFRIISTSLSSFRIDVFHFHSTLSAPLFAPPCHYPPLT